MSEKVRERPKLKIGRGLLLAREWEAFWMNQTQNSEEDHDNYFRRAASVDANMIHHLGEMIDQKFVEASAVEELVRALEFYAAEGDEESMWDKRGVSVARRALKKFRGEKNES